MKPTWLPLGLLDVIEHDLKRLLDDLHKVIVQDHGGALGPARFSAGAPIALSTRTYELFFAEPDGSTTTTYRYQPVAFFPMLIEDYEDVLHPNDWINRLIMDRAEPLSDYSLPTNAQRVAVKILRSDPELFLLFAVQLFPNENLMPELLAMRLKMELFACTLTPQQICTSAYRARNSQAARERVRQDLIDQAKKKELGP